MHICSTYGSFISCLRLMLDLTSLEAFRRLGDKHYVVLR
jgi:hypothetical protein